MQQGYAVCDLSFHVKRGEVMGLLGPNGAGKSTTMKMLTGFLPPSSGTASINGIGLEKPQAIQHCLGYLPENAPSYRDLDVINHLRFMGRMHGLPPATLSDRITEMSDVCGLQSVLHRRIDELSKGFRQRVGLAASMLHDPVCLILDEPTTGLDPNQIVEIRHLIRRLGEEKTVLLSSHVLSEVEAVCDRMMILDGGRLQIIGTQDELAQQAQGGIVLQLQLRGDVTAFEQAIKLALPACTFERTSKHEKTSKHKKTLEDSETFYISLRHTDGQAPLAETAFRTAVAHNILLLEMHTEQTSLEDVFHALTGADHEKK
ncbi:MAG: ATP-binding cassette domain-containing protein [Mariprofundaceae bacterium]|nr:ATP-binding cassette domain-containing protein [Mariprofundaceae bacterium]